MERDEFEIRLRASRRSSGAASIALSVAGATWEFSGIEPALRETLRARWGPFVAEPGARPDARVEVVDAGEGPWLPPPLEPEAQRIEPVPGTSPPAVVSYSFGLAPRRGGDAVLAVSRNPRETASRVLDNAARILVARWAAGRGGLAFHGAGVVRAGSAWVFVGPSRAGKSTAVRLSAPALSLGDDFAVVLPGAEGWRAAAVPFDNAEAVETGRHTGTVPLARVCRLFQSPGSRLERPGGPAAVASCLAASAFPWAVPDLGDAMADAASRLVADGRFVHLHFSQDPGFWSDLEADLRSA
jgi:hypothetical protein